MRDYQVSPEGFNPTAFHPAHECGRIPPPPTPARTADSSPSRPQLVALDWMVDGIERLGLSPILGDEMCASPSP